MAYTNTELFKHGEYPLAADLNKLLDNQTYFDVNIYEPIFGSKFGSRLVFVHQYKYLWFKGSGDIVDISDPTNTVSISESDVGVYTQYDLDSIDWMTYGKIYYVYNTTVAIESTD